MFPPKRILVIDDDEAVFACLQRIRGRLYDVLTTAEPQGAVDLAARVQPDLILCDMDMPDVNGVELSCRFFDCERTRKMPFAYLTSFVPLAAILRLRSNVGARRIITKTMPGSEMIATIERMLQ